MNEGTGYFFGSWLAALLSPPLNTYLFLFLIFLFMFFLFLVHRSFRDKMSSGNRVNIKRLYWGSMIIMGGSLILVLAFILIGVESIRKAEVKSTEEYLDSISRSTVIMMDNYLTRNLSFVTLEAGKEGLAERAGALAGLPGDRETLLGSEELSLFYDYMESNNSFVDSLGYLLISPDNIILASSHGQYVGGHSFLLATLPDIMEDVMKGNPRFIPPVAMGKGESQRAVMFYAAPVRDRGGRLIAVLAYAENPEDAFSEFCHLGRIGRSGETYAFDERAVLLSESFYESDLRRMGLLEENVSGILNIAIVDPGGNLKEGYIPELPPGDLQHTLMIKEALFSGNGMNLEGYRDYTGAMVWGAWCWIDHLDFGIATEIEVKDALATYYVTRRFSLMLFLIVAVLAVKLTLFNLGLGVRANKSLLGMNARLEKMVERRTKALSSANSSLKFTVEKLAEAKEKAEEADKSKSDFLTNISHEIRTPLNGIVGLILLMENTGLTEEQDGYLKKLTGSTRRLKTLVDDILDFSEAAKGRLSMERVLFRPQEVFEDVEARYRDAAEGKGLELSFQLAHRVPDSLEGDPHRLGQILGNLVDNGIKFSESGGVSVWAELLDKNADRAELIFYVSDKGIGLTGDQKSELFRAFTQGDASNTRRYGGAGLGLSLCKRLAELMGGKIGVESESGHGSTFFFTGFFDLPRILSDSVVPDSIRGARILVAEDNEINRLVIKEILEGKDFFVDLVENGDEAVRAILASPSYDAVLMDLQMPVMGGYEAAGKIRESHSFRELPIIALTADALGEARTRVGESGMQDYLAKPIDTDKLWNVLRQWIRPGERALPVREPSLSEGSSGEAVMPSIPGLNVEDGLARMGGNHGLYGKMLDRFCGEYGEMEKIIRDALEENRREDAVRAAHTVKGLGGNLGAEFLYVLSRDLEALIKERQPYEDVLSRFGKEIKSLVGNILNSGFLPEKDQAPAYREDVDPERIRDMIGSAIESLLMRKPKPAVAILGEIGRLELTGEARRYLEEVSDLLKIYRMKEAAALLGEMERIYEKEVLL